MEFLSFAAHSFPPSPSPPLPLPPFFQVCINPSLIYIYIYNINKPVAQKYVLLTYNIPRSKLPQVVKITPGKRAPTVTQLLDEGHEEWAGVSVMIETKKVASVMDQLEEAGASDILVLNLSNTRGT